MSEITDRRLELFQLFAQNGPGKDGIGTARAGIAPIKMVFDHEPRAGGLVKPASLTIAHVATRVEDSYAHHFAIRIYRFADAGPRQAQLDLDELIPTVDDLIPAEAGGPPTWEVEYADDLDAFIAMNLLEAPKLDF